MRLQEALDATCEDSCLGLSMLVFWKVRFGWQRPLSPERCNGGAALTTLTAIAVNRATQSSPTHMHVA